MSESPKVRLTPEGLRRLKEEAAAARARTEAAWTRAREAAPPPEATRSEPERVLRTFLLGLAAVAAYLPSAFLADGNGSVVAPAAALKNTLAVLFLTVIPSLVSARTERDPSSEDAASSRFARRFSPLVVGILLMLSIPMAWVPWPTIEASLIAQGMLGLYLHVPRARACFVFCILWGAAASTTIDERAGVGLGVAFALVVLAAVLDRSLDVRVALGVNAPAPGLKPLVVAASLIVAIGLALFGGAFWLVHGLELELPQLKTTTLPRSAVEQGPSTLDLFVALAIVILLLGGYHLIFGRLERREDDGADLEDEEAADVPPLESLGDDSALDTTGWPAGPRRTLVERYLAHLARLRSLGSPRSPGQAPLELAETLGERAPSVLERARRLATGFHRARYSPGAVSSEAVESVARDASEIEQEIGRRGPAPE